MSRTTYFGIIAGLAVTVLLAGAVGVSPPLAVGDAAQQDSTTVYFPFVSGRPPSYRVLIQKDNPTSYWRLDEVSGTTATDVQGNQDGVYTGGYTLNQPGALRSTVDAAVLLNGKDGYVNVPYKANLITPDFTLEIWAKMTAARGVRQGLMTLRDGTVGTGISLDVGPTLQPRILMGSGGAGGGDIAFPFAATMTTGQWYDLVVTFDGSTLREYVNGVQTNATAASYAPITSPGGWLLGQGALGFFSSGTA